MASTAGLTNAATNLGANGLEFINADLTLALMRRPVGLEIGIVAIDRLQRNGVVVGTARVLDRLASIFRPGGRDRVGSSN